MTPFQVVFDHFFTLITDDMYMEITKEDTTKDCINLLMQSFPLFEFPTEVITFQRKFSADGVDISFFDNNLTIEEINILATGMVQIWVQRQIHSIEVTRQKFSGSDFKLTSQASHLQRLMALLQKTIDEHRRLQMLHTRRRVVNGKYESTFDNMVRRRN